MTEDQKALAIGILSGILISLLVFAGGISIWIQLSSKELRIPANQPTSATVGGFDFTFVYDPNSKNVTEKINDQPESNFPANVGFGASWGWGRFTVTEVTPDHVTLFFRPWRFMSIQDV